MHLTRYQRSDSSKGLIRRSSLNRTPRHLLISNQPCEESLPDDEIAPSSYFLKVPFQSIVMRGQLPVSSEIYRKSSTSPPLFAFLHVHPLASLHCYSSSNFPPSPQQNTHIRPSSTTMHLPRLSLYLAPLLFLATAALPQTSPDGAFTCPSSRPDAECCNDFLLDADGLSTGTGIDCAPAPKAGCQESQTNTCCSTAVSHPGLHFSSERGEIEAEQEG